VAAILMILIFQVRAV